MDAVARPRARDTHRIEEQPHIEAVNTKVKLMMSPFNTFKQPSRLSAWALILGGAYGLVLCVFAGIGLGMIVGQRGMSPKEAFECARIGGGNLSIEQSKRFPTGAVKVRSADVLSSHGVATLASGRGCSTRRASNLLNLT